jgi:hypothetical protein
MGPSRRQRKGSPRAVCIHPSCTSLPSPYSRSESGGRGALMHHRSSGPSRFAPGALAPVRVIVSRSIFAYSAPCAPLAGTARLRRRAAYTRCLRCVPTGPRRPASGSELSLPILSRHVALYDPGKFDGCTYPVPSPPTLAFVKA